ncbi:MAG: hypothetical protein COA79_19195 [Planctomycetota bacterium]|nr:MAG: hypothetical protein COA79_19195 [Planctomycetota bacterium]
MVKQSITFLCLFLLSSIVCFNAERAKIHETKILSKKIFLKFKNEKFDEGFELFKDRCLIEDVEINKLKTTIKTQWVDIIKKSYGDSISLELTKEEEIGNSFIRYTYLHKFKKTVLVWVIVFYKPEDTWKVHALSYSGNLEPLYKLKKK